MSFQIEDDHSLILAAEDFELSEFSKTHRFSKSDERLLSKLMSHGPVLLKGGRGAGKSALMIEASIRLSPKNADAPALGVYISLRHLELLKSEAREYELFFCKLLIAKIRELISELGDFGFSAEPTVASIQIALAELTQGIGKRIVLYFDDAAHIGREASLSEFFDIFRTISSSTVSCKAAIYPGVTRFGTRFDVYNDATVLDVTRPEHLGDFNDFYSEIMSLRFRETLPAQCFTNLEKNVVAGLLARSVLGNMRSFIFACNHLAESTQCKPVGYTEVTSVLLFLASNYYWPLLEELRPKLGIYEPLVEPANAIAQTLYEVSGRNEARMNVLIHRDIKERLAKPLEILEYAGFISLRDVSRAMKSGGRGTRYALSLCLLLENTHGARLTRELADRWTFPAGEPQEFHSKGSDLTDIQLPELKQDGELGILSEPIETLAKSQAYPYGLTNAKIAAFKDLGLLTIGDLARATDDKLKEAPGVGDGFVKRTRNVLGQAIWM